MPMTRSQKRVARDSFSEMKFFAMKSGFVCPARPSSMFAPIAVAESSSFMLSRLTTAPRSCNRTPSSDTSHANRNALSHRSCSLIMTSGTCRFLCPPRSGRLFLFFAFRCSLITASCREHCQAVLANSGRLISQRCRSCQQHLSPGRARRVDTSTRATLIDSVQALRFD